MTNLFTRKIIGAQKLFNEFLSPNSYQKIIDQSKLISLNDERWPLAVEISLEVQDESSGTVTIGFPVKNPQNEIILENLKSLIVKNEPPPNTLKHIKKTIEKIERNEESKEKYPSRVYFALETGIDFMILTFKDPYLNPADVESTFNNYYGEVAENLLRVITEYTSSSTLIEHIGVGERSGNKVFKVYLVDEMKTYISFLEKNLSQDHEFYQLIRLKEISQIFEGRKTNIVLDIVKNKVVRIGVELKLISVEDSVDLVTARNMLADEFLVQTMPENFLTRIKKFINDQEGFTALTDDNNFFFELYHLKVSFQIGKNARWKLYVRC